MRIQTALVLASLFIGPNLSAADDIYHTDAYPNGRYWKLAQAADDTHQGVYLSGYVDAIRAAATPLYVQLTKCGCSVADIQRGVTAFYDLDPA